MTVLHKSTLPDTVRGEIVRLKTAGFSLLPLGGVDGKAPLLRAWASKEVTLEQVLAPMYRTGSQTYGVRLDGLVVIDCDSDDSDLVEQMEAHFGQSPIQVKTPRGRHLYYRAAGDVPNLRSKGLLVDIKTGARSYVVGPLSSRFEGGFYYPVKGLLGKDAIPPPLRSPVGPMQAQVPVGSRHKGLVREAMSMVELVDNAEELQANLSGICDDTYANPETMTDIEVGGIADWAWKCRLENRIYRGRDSAFSMHRLALDALRGITNQVDAIALLAILEDQHGHSPGKRFPLDFKAMRAAGLIKLSTSRLRAARRALEGAGLLKLAGKHRAGSKPQTFVHKKLYLDIGGAENVQTMPNARGDVVKGKEGGEG